MHKKSRPRSLPPTDRISVSFPKDIYAELERIAEAKKVSLAWVVREAAEKYVADQQQLFRMGSSHGSKTT
jgi:metal-responsive CopG/Arc/MetJ family transcriptional regulator